MKKVNIILVLMITGFTAISQKVYFNKSNYADSANMYKHINTLTTKVMQLYKEADETKHNAYMMTFMILQNNYDAAMHYINKYAILDHSDSIKPTGLFFPFRIYIQSKQQQISYNQAFYNYYKTLTVPDDISWVDEYFNDNSVANLNNGYNQLITDLKNKDSLTITEAEQLCFYYCHYRVYNETFTEAKAILTKIDNDKYIIEDSVLIKMPNGANISFCIVRQKKITKPLPVVMRYSIYPGKEVMYAKEAAANGFVGVMVNTRGKNLSTNAINPFEYDAEDAYYIIDWISKATWCNGKVGMFGGSYLGFSQWSATRHLHPALKTIVPQVAVAPGIDYPDCNGIFMSYMLQWIHKVSNNKMTDNTDFYDNKKWDKLYKDWYNSGTSFNKLDSIEGGTNILYQRWLQHPVYDSYWQKQTPQATGFAHINIPVLTITGYWDDEQLGALYYFKQHNANNIHANHYFVIGPYNHHGSQGYPSSVLEGYTLDSVANINIETLVYDWFNYTLKDSAKPTFLANKINFQIMGKNQWKSDSLLSNMHNDSLVYYLCSNLDKGRYSLSTTMPAANQYIHQTIDFNNKKDALTLSPNINEIYPKCVDTFLYTQKKNLVFVSPAFDKPTIVSGNITAALDVIINKKDVDIVMDVFELLPNGKYMFLNEVVQRASHVKSIYKRQLLKPNPLFVTSPNFTYNYFKLYY